MEKALTESYQGQMSKEALKNKLLGADHVVVVDLDGTLFIDTWASKFLFRLGKMAIKAAMSFQRLNKVVARTLSYLYDHEKVFILTARRDSYLKRSINQLRRHNIRYNGIINYDSAIAREDRSAFKESVMSDLKQHFSRVHWIDDEETDGHWCMYWSKTINKANDSH